MLPEEMVEHLRKGIGSHGQVSLIVEGINEEILCS